MDEILAALDAGERDRAFALLRDYLRRNPRDADAWLAMADAAPAPRQQADSLRRALSLAPGHARADEIRARLAALEAPTPAPLVEDGIGTSPVAASVAAPEPAPLSAGEMAMLESERDAPHPDTVAAAEVASATVERSYAAELAELDEVSTADDAVALDETYEGDAESSAGSSVWMLLVLAGALLFCIGLFVLLGDLTR